MSEDVPGALPRPLAVPIVAAFLFAASVIAVVVGFSLLFPNRLLDRLWTINPAGAVFFRSVGSVSGVFLLMLGVALLLAARGSLRGSKWAWRFAIALFAINGCGDIVSYFLIHEARHTMMGVIISFAFLCALCHRRVRCYFF